MLYFDGYGLLTPVEPDDTYILWIVQQGSDGRLHDIVTKDREHFFYC